MPAECVRLERRGPIAAIVLDRPEKRNALTSDMYRRIGELLAGLEADASVRVVVLRGEGPAFSAGFDLTLQTSAASMEANREFLFNVANANRWRLWRMGKPVIAQLHGFCMAGALELVLPCDFVIAAEDCQMGEPEILFGTGSAFLMVPWLVGVRAAKDILMTGRRFSGREAAQWGLITQAVPAVELAATVQRLAEHLAKLPPPALKVVKAGINRSYEIRGMQTAIDTWSETVLSLEHMETDEVREFKRIVQEQGVKAGVAWRDAYYARALAGPDAGAGGAPAGGSPGEGP